MSGGEVDIDGSIGDDVTEWEEVGVTMLTSYSGRLVAAIILVVEFVLPLRTLIH